MEKLGRLDKVELREVWEDEASNFTPWLADEENIILIGEMIGLELEVEAQEKNVGPFRADILCKDTVTDNWVLIENQLERTNHTHLGQLLTYAAGLGATTMVWIAKRFTDEHRAALDRLNEITAEEFRFFGLEIELWRIGDSPMAPKFNIVSHPNDWTKTVSRISPTRELTSTNQLYLEYWTGLRDLLEQRNGVIVPRKPSPENWTSFAIGRSGFHITARVNVSEKWICVQLVLKDQDADSYFYLLERDKVDIEEEIGAELEWRENPGLKEKHIRLSLDTDLDDRQDWDKQHQWLFEQLEIFYKVFSSRVKTLDARDYLPEENETAE